MGQTCNNLKSLMNGEYELSTLSPVQLKHLQDNINQELFNIAKDEGEQLKMIEALTDKFVGRLSQSDRSAERDHILENEILPEITKFSAYFGLDVGSFNKLFGSYFSILGENGLEKEQFPLLLQEEAIFNGVSFLLGDSKNVADKILASLKGKVSKINEDVDINKEERFVSTLARLDSVTTDVLAVDAIAGSGKTKLVANAILRISEKMGKEGKTLVTSPVEQMSRDIFDETSKSNLGQDESLSLKEMYSKIEDGTINLNGIDTILIDEATLIDFSNNVKYDAKSDRYVDSKTGEVDNSNSFTKFYNLAKAKNKNIKILLLGDTYQMSKLNGDSKVIDDTEIVKGTKSLFKTPLLKTAPLEQSFRTSSILLQDAYNQILKNNGDLFSISNPLKTEFAVSIQDSDKFLGVKINNNSVVDAENKKEARLQSIKDAFLQEGKKGLTILDSIKSQAKRNKGISLIIATDLDITENELLDFLKEDEAFKELFDVKNFSENPETEDGKFKIDLKVFTKNLSKIQGSEADYVIAEISNEPNANNFVHLPKDANGEDIFRSNNYLNKGQVYEALYTLITRGKSFVNVVNNTTNVNMQSTFNLQAFGLIEPEELVEDANKARELYKEILSTELNEDVIADMATINWDTNSVNIKEEEVNTEKTKLPKKTTEIEINTELDLKNKLAEVDSNYPETIEYYIEKQANLIDQFVAIDKDDNSIKKDNILNQINELDNIINIKKYLYNTGTNSYEFNNLSKVLTDIEDSIKDLNPKDRAEYVAHHLNQNGYAYTYFKTKDFTENGEVSKEDAEKNRVTDEANLLQQLIGENNISIEADIDVKFEILNLKKKSESSPTVREFSYYVKKEKDEDGQDILRLYTVAKLDYKGKVKYALVLTNNISLWSGDKAITFKENVTKALGDDNIVRLSDKNNKALNKISSVVELVTAGSIIRAKQPISLNTFIKDMKSKNNKVNFSNNIYTVVDSTSKFRGKQLVFYSYSENIDLDSADFSKWTEAVITDSEGDLTKTNAFYKKNGVNHAIGILVLNNDTYELKELIEATKDKRGPKNKDINSFILSDKSMDSSIKTLAYFYLRSQGISNPMNPTDEDNKKFANIPNGMMLQSFITNQHFSYNDKEGKQVKVGYSLFGESNEKQEEAEALFDNINKYAEAKKSSGMTFSSMLKKVFADIGSFELKEGSLVPVRTGKTDSAKVNFGKFITIASTDKKYSGNFKNRSEGSDINPVMFFDLNGLITYIENNNYKTDGEKIIYDDNYTHIIDSLEAMFKTNTVTPNGFLVYPDLVFNGKDTIVTTINRIDVDLKTKMTVNIQDVNLPNVIIKIDNLNNLIFNKVNEASSHKEDDFTIKKQEVKKVDVSEEENISKDDKSTMNTFSEEEIDIKDDKFKTKVKSDNGTITFINLESFDFDDDIDYIASLTKVIETDGNLTEFKKVLVSLIMNSDTLKMTRSDITGFNKVDLTKSINAFFNGEEINNEYKNIIDKAINC